MRRHRAALAGLLLVAAAAPGFVAALRQPAALAVELARVPYAQRFPSSQPVPMILNDIHDVDIVVFVNDCLTRASSAPFSGWRTIASEESIRAGASRSSTST